MEQNLNFNLVGNNFASNNFNNTFKANLTLNSSPTSFSSMPSDSSNITKYPVAPQSASGTEEPGLISRFTKWLAKVTFEPIMNLVFSVFRPR